MISKRQPITSVLVGAAMLVAAPWSGRAARADAGAGDATATQCGAISYVGCCAAATLHYCQSGQLVQKQCSNACGWNAAFALYGCGNSTAADPSNTHARECPAGDGGLPDAATDGPPPDDSSGPDAAGLDGQGGDGAGPDAAGCGAVPYAGCCDGDTLRFCAGNAVLALSCAAGSCGWSTARGYYSCDTSGGADPSSTYLKSCAQVVGDAGLPDAPTPRDAMALPDASADGAADAPRDQSSADAGDGGQPSADASGDADVGAGAPDVRGVDAVGFDGAQRDSGAGGDSESGCVCAARRAGDGAAGSAMLVLALLALLALARVFRARTRRRS